MYVGKSGCFKKMGKKVSRRRRRRENIRVFDKKCGAKIGKHFFKKMGKKDSRRRRCREKRSFYLKFRVFLLFIHLNIVLRMSF